MHFHFTYARTRVHAHTCTLTPVSLMLLQTLLAADPPASHGAAFVMFVGSEAGDCTGEGVSSGELSHSDQLVRCGGFTGRRARMKVGRDCPRKTPSWD